MKTVYLAGKITGDPGYKQKFANAAAELEKAGFIVLNPAILPAEGFTYEAYLRMSMAMLEECEAVCFLPDWIDSRGAAFECGAAMGKGKCVFMFEDWRSKPCQD